MPRVFWYLWAGTLLNRLGSFVLPFLALFLTTQRSLSPGEAALAVSLYGAGGFAASFAGGFFADHLGRRATLVTSMFAGAAAMVAVPFMPNRLTLGLTVTMLGFFGELYRPAVAAAVADLLPDDLRARAYALLYWATNIGAALAPVLAGLLAARSYTALFLVDGVTMASYGLIVLARVPETRPARTPAGDAPRGSSDAPPGWRTALTDPALLALSALVFVLAALFFQGFTTLPLSMRSDGLSEAQYGLAIAANGGLIVLLSLPVARWVERLPPTFVLAAAAVLIGVGFGLTGAADTLPLYVASIVIWTLGEIVMAPVAPALVSRLAPEQLRGVYQGIYHGAWGLALLVGPAAGGLVFERLGEATLWNGCLAAGLIAAAGFAALRLRTRRAVGS